MCACMHVDEHVKVHAPDRLATFLLTRESPTEPPVVVVYSRLGAEWDQVDVLECPGGATDYACVCKGEERYGCFGAALSVYGGMLLPAHVFILVYIHRCIYSCQGQGDVHVLVSLCICMNAQI